MPSRPPRRPSRQPSCMTPSASREPMTHRGWRRPCRLDGHFAASTWTSRRSPDGHRPLVTPAQDQMPPQQTPRQPLPRLEPLPPPSMQISRASRTDNMSMPEGGRKPNLLHACSTAVAGPPTQTCCSCNPPAAARHVATGRRRSPGCSASGNSPPDAWASPAAWPRGGSSGRAAIAAPRATHRRSGHRHRRADRRRLWPGRR